MLWGTRPELDAKGVKADLDGDGKIEFGEVAARRSRLQGGRRRHSSLYADKLDRAARAWKPTASDAFTAVVVMVPTMSEYFGQWKISRFVLGDRASGDAFNVVSRLSDIGDILGGLRVIYAGIRPAIANVDPSRPPRRSASSTACGSSSRSSRSRSAQDGASRRSRRRRSVGRRRSARLRSRAR